MAAVPFSDLVASGSCDGLVRLWRVERNDQLVLIKTLPVGGWVTAM